MKNTFGILALLFGALIVSAPIVASVHADDLPCSKSRGESCDLELGGGVARAQDGNLEFLIQMNGALNSDGKRTFGITSIVSFKAEAGLGFVENQKSLSTLDVEVKTFAIRKKGLFKSQPDTSYFEIIPSVWNVELDREVGLDYAHTSATVLGFRAESRMIDPNSSQFSTYIRLALDLLRFNNGMIPNPQAAIEAGIVVQKRFRISWGAKGEWDPTGMMSPSYQHDSRMTALHGPDASQLEGAYYGKAYAEAAIKLSETLELFGKANYSVFSYDLMDPAQGRVSKDGFRFLFGVSAAL